MNITWFKKLGTKTVEMNEDNPLPVQLRTSGGVEVLPPVLPATLGQKTMAASLPVAVASDQDVLGVKLPGSLVTLHASGAIAATGTTYGAGGAAGVTGLDVYTLMSLQKVVSAKNLAAGGTVNVYLQRSIDGGVTWDDLVAFSQITNAAVANDTYVRQQNAAGIATDLGAARAVTDGTLTAGTARDIAWGDRVRVKVVAAAFGVGDTVTLALTAYMQ